MAEWAFAFFALLTPPVLNAGNTLQYSILFFIRFRLICDKCDERWRLPLKTLAKVKGLVFHLADKDLVRIRDLIRDHRGGTEEGR